MEKHEPGPWILGGASGRMVTTPSGYTGDGFIAEVDTLANARLISAAPELLVACQNLIQELEAHDIHAPMRLKYAKDAVAKAESE